MKLGVLKILIGFRYPNKFSKNYLFTEFWKPPDLRGTYITTFSHHKPLLVTEHLKPYCHRNRLKFQELRPVFQDPKKLYQP